MGDKRSRLFSPRTNSTKKHQNRPANVQLTERFSRFGRQPRLCLIVFFGRQPRQGFDSVGLFLGVDVGVELHGEANVGVPCQHLGGLGYNVGVAQVRDERMP